MGLPKPRVALFDLDHTLLPIDSDYSWGVFTQQIGWTDPAAFKLRNDEFFAQYKSGTLDIHEYVRFATEAVRLRGAQEAALAHEHFMRTMVHPAIRSEAVELIRSHQEAGDHVAIVTATNEFVTAPIAFALGVEELIAVELERGGDGWITGNIKGVPSSREGKVTRVQDWLASRGWDWASVDSSFYSDSINDLALLEKVDHPVATNPDERLRAIALERGWRILDLFEKT
jgi:HAD superfamily hydrolase (TIGR01490 family)